MKYNNKIKKRLQWISWSFRVPDQASLLRSPCNARRGLTIRFPYVQCSYAMHVYHMTHAHKKNSDTPTPLSYSFRIQSTNNSVTYTPALHTLYNSTSVFTNVRMPQAHGPVTPTAVTVSCSRCSPVSTHYRSS